DQVAGVVPGVTGVLQDLPRRVDATGAVAGRRQVVLMVRAVLGEDVVRPERRLQGTEDPLPGVRDVDRGEDRLPQLDVRDRLQVDVHVLPDRAGGADRDLHTLHP